MKPALLIAAALSLALGHAAAQSIPYSPPTAGTPVPMPPGMQLPPPRPAPSPSLPATPPATAPGATPAPAPPGWEPRQAADVLALDKVDDKRGNLTIAINQSAQFGHLTIAVRACVVRPADQATDAAAWLDITDPRPDASSFHGWMLLSEPAASMFQHPVYDVRLLGCH